MRRRLVEAPAAARGPAQRQQQGRAPGRSRRLDDGTLEERERRLGRSSRERPLGRRLEAVDDDLVTGRVGGEKVDGDAFSGHAELLEHQRRTAVFDRPASRRDVGVDGLFEDGVSEPQRSVGRCEDVGVDQRVGGFVSAVDLEAGQRRGGAVLGVGAEDRDGARQGERVGPHRGEAAQDRMADRARAERPCARSGLLVPRQRGIAERSEQLLEEERVPSGHLPAGAQEPRSRTRRRIRRSIRTRTAASDRAEGSTTSAPAMARSGSSSSDGAPGSADRMPTITAIGRSRDPPAEVVEEQEAGRGRPSGRRRRSSPPASRRRGSRSASTGRDCAAKDASPSCGEAPSATDRPSAGRASEAAPRSSERRRAALAPYTSGSKSWRATPHANSRSRSAPAADSTVKPESLGSAASPAEQRGLADPGFALDDHEPAPAVARVIERPAQGVELCVTIEERLRGFAAHALRPILFENGRGMRAQQADQARRGLRGFSPMLAGWRPARARSSRTCRSSARGRRASSGRPSSSCSSTSSTCSRSPRCPTTCSTTSAGRPRPRRRSCSSRCTGPGTTRRG